jgi:uncharacterized iron-regulated membrane protein
VRKAHKWLGLLLGLQVLLWVSGGVVMSIIPIEQVRGEAWLPVPSEMVDAKRFTFPASGLPVAEVRRIEMTQRMGTPLYVVEDQQGERHGFSGIDGHPVPELGADEVAAWVRQLHKEQPEVADVHWIEHPEGEVRGRKGPLWRVDLRDSWNMSVYVDPLTGQLSARRNDLWRVYDFFWMLHIMDYGTRDDFNNNLLRASAGLTWFFVLSGLWLIVYSFRRQDFRWLLRSPHRRHS